MRPDVPPAAAIVLSSWALGGLAAWRIANMLDGGGLGLADWVVAAVILLYAPLAGALRRWIEEDP